MRLKKVHIMHKNQLGDDGKKIVFYGVIKVKDDLVCISTVWPRSAPENGEELVSRLSYNGVNIWKFIPGAFSRKARTILRKDEQDNVYIIIFDHFGVIDVKRISELMGLEVFSPEEDVLLKNEVARAMKKNIKDELVIFMHDEIVPSYASA